MSQNFEELKKGIERISSTASNDFSIYWGKKNPLVAEAIINAYAATNSVILDPFLGSGSTFYGFLKSKTPASFIGIDVNEQPIKQINFNMAVMNEDELIASFENFKKIAAELNIYTFTLNGAEFEITKAILDIEPEPRYLEFHIIDLSTNRKNIINIKHEFFDLLRSKMYDLNNIPEAKQNIDLEANSRIAVKNGMKLSDLYSPRSFDIIINLKKAISEDPILAGVVSSVLHLIKYTDKGSQSQFPYWFPRKNAVERNPLYLISKKYEEIIKTISKPEAKMMTLSSKYNLIVGDVKKLSQYIKPEIDLIITDPPYFDQVAYSEYLVPWQFFMGSNVDIENEIVQSNRKTGDKTRDKYLLDMQDAFLEIAKVSKPGAYLFLYFKDSRLSNISALLDLLAFVGWTFTSQIHVNRGAYTYKQNSSKRNTVPGDCILIFRLSTSSKPNPRKFETESERDEATLALVANAVKKYEKITISQLYDEVIVPHLYAWGHLGDFKEPGQIIDLIDSRFKIDPTTRKITI